MSTIDSDNDCDTDAGCGDWGYSTTAIAIKWAFVGAIVLLLFLWFAGGYFHAQRRIKRGLPPLAYHRWLLPRRQRMQYTARPHHGFYPQQSEYSEGIAMQNFTPPPPAYNGEHIPPPVYQPPEHASKVDPSQNWTAAPPPGPPPGYVVTGESSSLTQNSSSGRNITSQ